MTLRRIKYVVPISDIITRCESDSAMKFQCHMAIRYTVKTTTDSTPKIIVRMLDLRWIDLYDVINLSCWMVVDLSVLLFLLVLSRDCASVASGRIVETVEADIIYCFLVDPLSLLASNRI